MFKYDIINKYYCKIKNSKFKVLLNNSIINL